MKFLTFITISILAMITISSCNSSKKFEDMTSKDVQVILSKGACFGTCPVYEMSIYKGGFAHFYGKKYSDKDGKWLKKLDKATYDSLIAKFKAANWNSLQDQYESDIADAPTIRITYDGKKVMGKDGLPKIVTEMQAILEDIASGREGWKQIEKFDGDSTIPERFGGEAKTKDKPSYIYNEIILEPTPGSALSRTMTKYRELYGLRLLKKVSTGSNLWLVTFDATSHAAKEVLEALKSDNSIKNAEFNVKTQMR